MIAPVYGSTRDVDRAKSGDHGVIAKVRDKAIIVSHQALQEACDEMGFKCSKSELKDLFEKLSNRGRASAPGNAGLAKLVAEQLAYILDIFFDVENGDYYNLPPVLKDRFFKLLRTLIDKPAITDEDLISLNILITDIWKNQSLTPSPSRPFRRTDLAELADPTTLMESSADYAVFLSELAAIWQAEAGGLELDWQAFFDREETFWQGMTFTVEIFPPKGDRSAPLGKILIRRTARGWPPELTYRLQVPHFDEIRGLKSLKDVAKEAGERVLTPEQKKAWHARAAETLSPVKKEEVTADAADSGMFARVKMVETESGASLRVEISEGLTEGIPTKIVTTPEGTGVVETGQLDLASDVEYRQPLTHIALVVDTSGSHPPAEVEKIKRMVKQFIDQLPENVKVAIINVRANAKVTDFYSDKKAAKRAVDGLTRGGATNVYSSMAKMSAALRDEMDKDTAANAGVEGAYVRGAMFVLCDRSDTSRVLRRGGSEENHGELFATVAENIKARPGQEAVSFRFINFSRLPDEQDEHIQKHVGILKLENDKTSDVQEYDVGVHMPLLDGMEQLFWILYREIDGFQIQLHSENRTQDVEVFDERDRSLYQATLGEVRPNEFRTEQELAPAGRSLGEALAVAPEYRPVATFRGIPMTYFKPGVRDREEKVSGPLRFTADGKIYNMDLTNYEIVKLVRRYVPSVQFFGDPRPEPTNVVIVADGSTSMGPSSIKRKKIPPAELKKITALFVDPEADKLMIGSHVTSFEIDRVCDKHSISGKTRSLLKKSLGSLRLLIDKLAPRVWQGYIRIVGVYVFHGDDVSECQIGPDTERLYIYHPDYTDDPYATPLVRLANAETRGASGGYDALGALHEDLYGRLKDVDHVFYLGDGGNNILPRQSLTYRTQYFWSKAKLPGLIGRLLELKIPLSIAASGDLAELPPLTLETLRPPETFLWGSEGINLDHYAGGVCGKGAPDRDAIYFAYEEAKLTLRELPLITGGFLVTSESLETATEELIDRVFRSIVPLYGADMEVMEVTLRKKPGGSDLPGVADGQYFQVLVPIDNVN
ncbi:MAG: VWA domain-containing protein [bacterium]